MYSPTSHSPFAHYIFKSQTQIVLTNFDASLLTHYSPKTYILRWNLDLNNRKTGNFWCCEAIYASVIPETTFWVFFLLVKRNLFFIKEWCFFGFKKLFVCSAFYKEFRYYFAVRIFKWFFLRNWFLLKRWKGIGCILGNNT